MIHVDRINPDTGDWETIEREASPLDLDAERAQAQTALRKALQRANKQLTSQYTQTEMDSWPLKKLQAQAIKDGGSESDAPLLVKEAARTGETVSDLATKVLANAAWMEDVTSDLVGIRRTAQAALDGAGDVTSIKSVMSIARSDIDGVLQAALAP